MQARVATPPTPRQRARVRRGRVLGLTLLETAVVLTLLLIVSMFALPSWRHWIGRQELANRAQALATALERARTEAIKRGHRVNLCKSPDATTCADAGDWSDGWMLHSDAEAEGQPARDEPPIAWDPPVGASIHVDGNGPVDDYVSFTPLGEPRRLSGALQMGTFTLCRSGHDEVQVVLAATGRVRTVRTHTRCP
ncbi:MAG: GspH/FimT family pseudopilin [Betaproteobacteria bacterium]